MSIFSNGIDVGFGCLEIAGQADQNMVKYYATINHCLRQETISYGFFKQLLQRSASRHGQIVTAFADGGFGGGIVE